MVGNKSMPKAVLKKAYKLAVAQTMTQVFGTPAALAEAITADWWSRLAATKAMKSAIFLHSEPIKTAAALLERASPKLDDDRRVQYAQILRRSLETALREYRGSKRDSIKAVDSRKRIPAMPATIAS